MVNLKHTLRQLWLIFWKNLILRKRQYIVTALEIILPTLFAILIAYVRTAVGSNSSDWYDDTPGGPTIFQQHSEEQLIESAASQLTVSWIDPSSNISVYIAYAPNTNVIEDFVTNRLGPALTENPDRIQWKGFENDKEIEAFVAQFGLEENQNANRFTGAVVFKGLNSLSANDYPNNHKISYKIRLVDEFEDTTEIMPWLTMGVDFLNENLYFRSGFSGLQIIIDKLLIQILTATQPFYNISTQAFPFPETEDFDFNQVYFILLPQFLVLGFIFIVPSIVRGVVSEKETGIKELMKMTGLPNWMHWIGWMMNSMIVLLISITLIIILFFVKFSSKSGAVLTNSDPSLWWFVLFVYAIWATSFCFLISSIFERPTLATTVGIVLWLVTYYGVALPLEPGYNELALSSKLLLCLCPNMGLHYALKVMSSFEARENVGAQWNNIGESISASDSLTLGYVLLMLVVTTIVYIILAMYLENIIPTKYGVRKPWYFIFLPATWGLGKKGGSYDDISELREDASKAEQWEWFEKVPQGFKVGIEVLKLRKEFGKGKVAVDDVSVKAYEGQIFCLLGHNGAGKTTTMSILTGLLSSTSGTALINGRDIRSEMDTIRQDLGLCPQHNLLFSKLTVTEHLTFFGMVKGLTSSEAEKEVPELIQKLNLEEKANSLSMSLSGGQKRKLSLGCAIIGGSKVLFLDECSASLDPEARRVIWNLLLEIRGQRTIILTTHFLEEADVLGDRVVIMAGGRVQCCGSPMFLKKYYGTGYSLSLTLTEGGNPDIILQTIQKHVPTAFIKNRSDGELTITLPSENNNSSNFPSMFSDILLQKAALKIQDIGISLTTMDEVFIKVDELNHSANGSNPTTINNTDLGGLNNTNSNFGKAVGVGLWINQFWGLLLKKILYSLKRWKLTLSQMILPVGLLIAAILISNLAYGTDDNTPPLTMTTSSYKNQIVLYTANSTEIGEDYEKVVGSPLAKRLASGSSLDEELLKKGEQDKDTYIRKYIVAADLDGQLGVKAMFSTIPAHSCPLSINLATNTMLRHLDNKNSGYSIEVINHPLSSSTRTLFDAASPNPSFTEVTPFIVGILLSIGLALLAASFIVLPIEERICQSKQLQIMTGVNPLIYWGSSFLWDYFVMLVCICVMVACFPIFEKYNSFTNNGGAGVAFLIMAVYGIGAISFSYLLSLLAQSAAGGFALVTIIHLITGTAFALGVFIMQDDQQLSNAAKIVGWIGRLFPTYGVSKSVMVFTRVSTENSRCNVLTEDIKAIICRPNINIYNPEEFQSCCDNCEELGADCFKPQPYLEWTHQPEDLYGYQPSYPGVGQEICFMIIISLIYLTALLFVEFGLVKKLLNRGLKHNEVTFVSNSNDADVQLESSRVQSLLQSGRTSDDAVVIDNLCKSFGTFSAVSKLSFGVHHGECFGLLGVNGAGKTTSFRMLTGDEIISNGNAFINNNSLQIDRKKFLSSIGYCPQFDGIIGVLTGRQMLEIFARLRGIRHSLVTFEAQKWLNRMGLSESGDVQCQKYSGGMKRRLSAAMAMIGDPPIILLDEPMSGVDAVSRRQFWNIISSLRDSGQAIILTSHSMEECEFLCSRLGIMVNGELQCLGGVQHLKNKFAQGYSLTIRLKQAALLGQPESLLTALTYQVTNQFHPCSLKDQHQNTMQFHIETTFLPWDKLFETMESIKSQYEDYIEEYSLQQTTLEEVFLSFARKQYYDPREVNVSIFRKILSVVFGL